MDPITQEDDYGCGVACVAFITGKTYKDIIPHLGREQAQTKGFLGKELANVLEAYKLHYTFRYIKPYLKKRIYESNTIVFIKRSKRYPAGHYLVRCENGWMDPWINFQQEKDIRKARSGFRKRLPGEPLYALLVNLS